MQASWYELELGDSYQRAGMYSQALTQYTNVEKVICYPVFFLLRFLNLYVLIIIILHMHSHPSILQHFSDFVDDQYDFHSYCLRKMTVRAYLQLLRWEDSIHAHKFLFRAYCGVVKVSILQGEKGGARLILYLVLFGATERFRCTFQR